MEYFITASGIPVHVYESKKDGTAILLLHGYLETLYIWDNFVSLLPEEFRIISIDLPGCGLTGSPSESFDLTFLSDFIHQFLLRLNVDKCHIISHSCGFYVAGQFSDSYPETVLSITNLASNPTIDDTEHTFLNNIQTSISGGTFLKSVTSVISKMYFPQNLRSFDEKIQETAEICETHDPLGLSSFLNAISAYSLISLPATIPIFNIYGEYHLFSRPENNINSIIIPATGINSFIEKPILVSGYINDFIRTLSPKKIIEGISSCM